jgi:hypothetical protein
MAFRERSRARADRAREKLKMRAPLAGRRQFTREQASGRNTMAVDAAQPNR